jgi:hypothetical protein
MFVYYVVDLRADKSSTVQVESRYSLSKNKAPITITKYLRAEFRPGHQSCAAE